MSDTDEIEFLKSSELFENQSREMLRAITAQGCFRALSAGDFLFHQGEPGNDLFIVKSGVLEILATRSDAPGPIPVAYLGRGEVLGELALLTGSPRSAAARAPERAELFTLAKPVFLDLMVTMPHFARNLCVVLARRLETTTLKAPRSAAKQLQGNLRYFDLATVIQTLVGSHQTGMLTVAREGGQQRIAEILFLKGNIARAKLRQVSGDDAIFQLFQSPLDGEFSFIGRSVAEDEVQADITMPAISLLMESVRLQDELQLLRARLPDPERVYRQKAGQLHWDETDSVDLAAAVWARLKKGASVNDLQREIPRCTYQLYRVLVMMIDAGQVR
ncbi:MAG: cyclic nucleotide-binding domain-containing protein [Vicinamibacteria bacterium]|nr:cyclic nucleotide-binding domain-containing protein [Vicinamibacteria bacterium]